MPAGKIFGFADAGDAFGNLVDNVGFSGNVVARFPQRHLQLKQDEVFLFSFYKIDERLFAHFPHIRIRILRIGDEYEPHVQAWAAAAAPHTTLWFWNSEIGWAAAHPVLEKHGFRYVQCNVWNKGSGHIAGNVRDAFRQRVDAAQHGIVEQAIALGVEVAVQRFLDTPFVKKDRIKDMMASGMKLSAEMPK